MVQENSILVKDTNDTKTLFTSKLKEKNLTDSRLCSCYLHIYTIIKKEKGGDTKKTINEIYMEHSIEYMDIYNYRKNTNTISNSLTEVILIEKIQNLPKNIDNILLITDLNCGYVDFTGYTSVRYENLHFITNSNKKINKQIDTFERKLFFQMGG